MVPHSGGRSKASRNEALCMPRRHYCKPQGRQCSTGGISHTDNVVGVHGCPSLWVTILSNREEGRFALHATSFFSHST